MLFFVFLKRINLIIYKKGVFFPLEKNAIIVTNLFCNNIYLIYIIIYSSYYNLLLLLLSLILFIRKFSINFLSLYRSNTEIKPFYFIHFRFIFRCFLLFLSFDFFPHHHLPLFPPPFNGSIQILYFFSVFFFG